MPDINININPPDWGNVADLIKDVQNLKERHNEPLELHGPFQSTIPALKKLFLPFDSSEELHLRLVDSIIFIHHKPYHIWEGRYYGPQDFVLYLRDHSRQEFIIRTKFGVPDFRSPPPRYVRIPTGTVVYLCRYPAKVYKQGWSYANCVGYPLKRHRGDVRDGYQTDSNRQLLAWLDTKYQPWSERLDTEIREHPLSYYVAIGRYKNQISVNYKGRFLGYLKHGKVIFHDPSEIEIPWLRSDLEKAGLRCLK